ncbi:MAG: hypothetical protein A2X94_06515 [Bdellovibrionales bacterium GWB1_55_8]|nr:MAG: hypothetical protein A2X94_06515 [Bdellovibrionales bacterium GWB1_55_8]
MIRYLIAAVLVVLSTAHTAPVPAARCELWDDEQQIPHLRAKTSENIFACLGFVHGRDRAWQLDFFRRTARGTRAEVLGKDHIRSDFQMRLLDLPSKAKALWAAMPEQDRKLWSAYVSGVNHGIAAALNTGVYEFQHWEYAPESWTEVDSISLLLLQSFDQTRKSFAVQLDEVRRLERHGAAAPSLFMPDELEKGEIPWDSAVLKRGEFEGTNARKNPAEKTLLASSPPLASMGTPDTILDGFFTPLAGAGSNNWVIAPSRSKNGHAILANDPHLGLGYPPLWHLSHIESPAYEAFGAAMPGIPVIVSGANRRVAWGLTNSYLETARMTLVTEEDLRASTVHRPWIWVKAWKFKIPYFLKTFRRTPAGLPVLPIESPGGKAFVLNWTGFDLEPRDLSGLFPLMSARSVQDVDRTLANVGVPSWNFVFADTKGNIGYRAVGRVPRASAPRPLGVQTASLAALETTGFGKETLSASEMPHLINPRRGFLITANNRQWPRNSQFHGGWAYSPGFRAFRIEELLTRTPRHDVSSVSKMQCDVQAVDARFLAPLLIAQLEATQLSATEGAALQILRLWRSSDYTASLDCTACGLYRLWVNGIFTELLLDEASLYRKLRSNLDEPSRKIMLTKFREALKQLGGKAGNLPRWEQVHLNPFPHLGNENFFTSPGLPTPGDDESVNPGTSRWEKDAFRHTAGASQRLIVELSDPPSVYSVLPGPNVDHATRDLLSTTSAWRKWRDCQNERRHFPVNWALAPSVQLSF